MVLEGLMTVSLLRSPTKGLAAGLVLFTLCRAGSTNGLFRGSQPFHGKNAGGLETPKAPCQLNHAPYQTAVDMAFSWRWLRAMLLVR